jgi:hypothetical protein
VSRCALCLLTTPEISGTSPVRGRSFPPISHRPRARVLLVVWAWDFLIRGFFNRGLPALALNCFRSAICDCCQ